VRPKCVTWPAFPDLKFDEVATLNSKSNEHSRAEPLDALAKMLAAVATDAHFWVPTLVLTAGLMLLGWIR
jgi:hypothetical protein